MTVKGAILAVVLVTFGVWAWALRTLAAGQHSVVLPAEIKWGDAPPQLPKGIKVSALYGDPSKPGLFVLRIKVPANTRVMPHSHPTDENITVLSGGFGLGMGDRLDPATKMLPPGTFVSLPAGMHHFVITNQETIVELSSMGPFGITYVNPADDPSKGAGSKEAATTSTGRPPR